MTTEYSLADTLPKDLGGAKHLGVIDDQTSQLDYALIRGIASESLGGASRNLALLGVASHTIGSAVGHGGGVMSMGAYTESPSALGTGNAQAVRVDKQGAIYTRPASGILSFSSASVQTHVSGSLLLHDIHIVLNNVNSGNSVRIDDGTGYKLAFIATATSQHFSEHYSAGLVFNTSLKHTLTLGAAGTASVTISYSRQ